MSARIREHVEALLSAAAIAVTMPADVAPRVYTVDAARSSASFTLHYAGWMDAVGCFATVDGTLRVDPQSTSTLTAAIRIDVDSLSMQPEWWRHALLGPHFLDQRHYPFMEFNGDRVVADGGGPTRAWGTLLLHGVRRPVALTTRVATSRDEIQVDASTSLRRSAFGLHAWLPLASDEIRVTVHVTAIAAPPTP